MIFILVSKLLCFFKVPVISMDYFISSKHVSLKNMIKLTLFKICAEFPRHPGTICPLLVLLPEFLLKLFPSFFCL